MLCDQSHGALTSTDEEGVGHEGLEVVDLLSGLLSIKLAELKFDSLKKKNTGKVKKKRLQLYQWFPKRQNQLLPEGN